MRHTFLSHTAHWQRPVGDRGVGDVDQCGRNVGAGIVAEDVLHLAEPNDDACSAHEAADHGVARSLSMVFLS